MAPGSVILTEVHTHTHARLHTKPARCLTYTLYAKHIHTRSPSWRQTSPSVCVWRGNSMLSDKQGKSFLSCLVHHRPSHCPSAHGWLQTLPRPPRPGSKTKGFNQHMSTHTHPHAKAPLAPAGFPWRRDTRRQEVWGEVCVSLLLLEHFRSDLLLTRLLPPPSLRKQPYPCDWRCAQLPSVITSVMFWCEVGRLCELERQIHVDMFVFYGCV